MIGSQTERPPEPRFSREHAVVAAVEHVAAAVVGGRRAERRGGDEDRVRPEGAEHGRRPVERAVAGREGAVVAEPPEEIRFYANHYRKGN